MSNIDIFIWEFIGTAILCLIGNGAVAAVTLKNSYSHGGGGDWVIIVLGWGFAVFAGASIANPSGGHINPAVTLAVAIDGGVPWSSVPIYFVGQLVGGIVGATLCWAAFKLQFDKMEDNSGTRGIFCTAPAIRNIPWNMVTEVIGTFVLILAILLAPDLNGTLGYAAVSFVVIAIGFGLGGPDRLRHQPGARSRPPDRIRAAAHSGQGPPRLVVLLGAGAGSADRCRARGRTGGDAGMKLFARYWKRNSWLFI